MKIKKIDEEYMLISTYNAYDLPQMKLFGNPAMVPANDTGLNILKAMSVRKLFEDIPVELETDWNNQLFVLPKEMDKEFFKCNHCENGDNCPYRCIKGYWLPMEHQKDSIAKMCKFNHYGLFLEMGLGKTYVSIQVLRWLKLIGQYRTSLIVCPKNVIGTWISQLAKYCAEDEFNVIDVDNASTADKGSIIATGLLGRNNLLITNYESLLSSKKDLWFPGIKRMIDKGKEFGVIILDESTKIKNSNTARYEGLDMIKNFARRRYILTGFPSPQSPADYVSQCAFLHPGYLGYSSTGTFINDNAKRDYKGQIESWDSKQIELLKAELKVFATHQKLSDTDIKLPDKTYKTIMCTMGPEQKRVYEEMAALFVAWVEQHKDELEPELVCFDCLLEPKLTCKCKGTGYLGVKAGKAAIMAQNALVKVMRLLQISGGYGVVQNPCPKCEKTGFYEAGFISNNVGEFIPLHSNKIVNGKCVYTTPHDFKMFDRVECSKCKGKGMVSDPIPLKENCKMDALVDLVENQIQKPYIIFSHYRHEIEAISKRLNIPVLMGSNNKLLQNDELQKGLANGTYEGVVIQPMSGGMGVDGLQVCKTVIYYTNYYMLEARIQSEARAHRIGQKNNVLIIDLQCPGTADELVISRLQEKKEVALEILKFPQLVFGNASSYRRGVSTREGFGI